VSDEVRQLVKAMLDGLAAGVTNAAARTSDPAYDVAERAVGVILRLLRRLMDERTPDEAIAVLKRIVDEGSIVIRDDELDDQVKRIVAELGGGAAS